MKKIKHIINIRSDENSIYINVYTECGGFYVIRRGRDCAIFISPGDMFEEKDDPLWG